MQTARLYDKVRYRVERSGMKTQTAYRQVDVGDFQTGVFIPDGMRDSHSGFGRDVTVTVEYRLHTYVRNIIGAGTVEWLPVRQETHTADGVEVRPSTALRAALSHVEQKIQTAEQVRNELAAAFPRPWAPPVEIPE